MSLLTHPKVSAHWIAEIRRIVEAGLDQRDSGSIERIRADLTALAVHEDCPLASDFYDEADLANYRRHLLFGDDDSAWSGLLIKWPPNHVTPLHDHGGVWGIELVIDGALQVDEFVAADLAGAPTRLTPQRSLILGVSIPRRSAIRVTCIAAATCHRARRRSRCMSTAACWPSSARSSRQRRGATCRSGSRRRWIR